LKLKKLLIQTQEQVPTPILDRTDAVLAKQVLDGDQEAFELLVQRYNTPLFNFICRFLGDYDLACDVLQQVFLRFYLSLPRLGTGEPFKPWLFRVARNCCVDELRRKYRAAVHFSQFENSEGDLTGLGDIPDPEPLPEEVVERRDLQALLQDAIQTLPPKFRSVVILRYASQMSFPEIGRVLSMPEATAKTYFHRAKVSLRKMLLRRLQPSS
jgi:RNA polymerase sigma-70 factor (ECF subfamily)